MKIIKELQEKLERLREKEEKEYRQEERNKKDGRRSIKKILDWSEKKVKKKIDNK